MCQVFEMSIGPTYLNREFYLCYNMIFVMYSNYISTIMGPFEYGSKGSIK